MATITRTSDREREQLRRSAMAADQGPTDEQQQGSNRYTPAEMFMRLGEPRDPTDVDFPFLRLMRRDHMVAMGLHFIAMPIIKAPWYIECDNAQVAAFVDNILRPIYGRLLLTLLRFLSYGYSPAVKNFEVVDNPAWKYVPGLNEEPKLVWDSPSVGVLTYKPVTPLRPENAKPRWKDGNFDGIGYDARYSGAGYFLINGDRRRKIDVLHSVWGVHDQDNEDGNPFGFPRIAHCAPIFHMYRYIWTLLGRAFENNADPGPVVRYPMEDAAMAGSDGKRMPNVQTALRIGRRKRSGSTIALPSDPYRDFQDKPTGIQKWSIEYPKSETSFEHIQQFLGFLESAKLRALWLQEQGLIEGSGASSNRNVASEFGDQRDASQIVLMQQLDQFIIDVFVKPSLAMHLPWFEGKVEKKTLGFGSADEDIVRQIFQLMGQNPDSAGMARFGIDVRRLAESRGFPMLDFKAQQKLLEEAAASASNGGPPEVTPTQGRRALVTQTGFSDEPVYVQLGDEITLADDGDFVAGLPRTDVFADRAVVSAARSMRKEAKSFLSWLYDDFARYLGKQKSLDLAAELVAATREALAEDGDELDDDTPVRKVVDKVLSGWRPRAERLTKFSASTRSILGRVFDRTAGLQLSRVRSNVKLSAVDKDAAAWLDDHGAEMVSSVLDTTRDQLARVLADGIREGKRPRAIAQDIREHFEGFPEARAAAIARTEVSGAYNYATVRAGMKAGVKKAQLLDGNKDKPCRERNGKIVDLAQALLERLAHPNCTFHVRLLPRAGAALGVVRTALDGLHARFDSETETILFDPSISVDDEAAWLIALGDILAQPVEELEQEPQEAEVV